MEKFSKITEGLNSGKQSIGLDLHGVIDCMPEFFSFLTNAIVKAGGDVHIITGGSIKKLVRGEDIPKFLKDNNIAYTHLFSIQDHHDEIGTPKSGAHPKYGFPMITDEQWDMTKAGYCESNNISLHIDDTLMYNEFFTTPFARLWTHSNNPKVDKDHRHLA